MRSHDASGSMRRPWVRERELTPSNSETTVRQSVRQHQVVGGRRFLLHGEGTVEELREQAVEFFAQVAIMPRYSLSSTLKACRARARRILTAEQRNLECPRDFGGRELLDVS